MIRYLIFEIVLHNRHNGVYPSVTHSNKENKKTPKKQTQHPSCSSHLNKGAESTKEQKTNTQEKKQKL